MIDAIADSKKVNRILHLPLQSGSTNVLKSMNRRYTKEQYIELANKIKNKIPKALFFNRYYSWVSWGNRRRF